MLKTSSDTLFCTHIALKHHLIVKCDIQVSFWYIQDILQYNVGRCLQIHVILQDTKLIACLTNCGLQKDDCNADINLSRKLSLPQAKSRAQLKKCVLAKNCNWESWNKKSLRCNFKFINNKIMFMICKNTFKVYGIKRRGTFLLIAKDIFFKYMLHIFHVCENNAVYQCARCKVSIDSKTIKRVSNCNVKSSKGYILVPDDK